MYYQSQGDCMIKKIGTHNVFVKEYPDIPKEAVKQESNLVLKGQDNSHALYGGKFEILEHEKVKFIRVFETTTLDHVKDLTTMQRAEHHAQDIEPGEYFVDQVQEFDYLANEARAIID